MNRPIEITINGERYEGMVENRTLLVDFIRETAELTGTHVGCASEGRCGACTVLMNGEAVKSCLLLAVQADGFEVQTIEGLARNGKLHPLQEAFWENHGLQCGYCTTGILMSASDYLERNPRPDEAAVRDMLSGHLCRCTGYVGMVRAILDVAEERARD